MGGWVVGWVGGGGHRTCRHTASFGPVAVPARAHQPTPRRRHSHPALAHTLRPSTGTDLLPSAMEGSGTQWEPKTIPQIWACPCAEMLAEEAGNEPGALGAWANWWVAADMRSRFNGWGCLVVGLPGGVAGWCGVGGGKGSEVAAVSVGACSKCLTQACMLNVPHPGTSVPTSQERLPTGPWPRRCANILVATRNW